jgi:prevent-host-death family protein
VGASVSQEVYTLDMSEAPHHEMLEVGIRRLREHLGRYLDEVRAGREVLVTDRGRPVARIVASSGRSRLDELVAAGIVTLPEHELDPSSFGRVRVDGDLMEFLLDQRR